MALDPHRIDISLALLPGESQAVVESLVARLEGVSAQLAALAEGKVASTGYTGQVEKSSAVQGGVDPLDVNIVSVSPGISLTGEPVRLGQATPTHETSIGGMPPAAMTPMVGAATGGGTVTYSSSSAGQTFAREKMATADRVVKSTPFERAAEALSAQEDADTEWAGDLEEGLELYPGAISPSRSRISKALDPLVRRKQLTQEQLNENKAIGNIDLVGSTWGRAKDALTVEDAEGNFSPRETFNSLRDTALAYGVFQHGRNSETGDELKRSFSQQNMNTLGTQLGGEAPSTNYGMDWIGNLTGVRGVLPGTSAGQAILGMLGNDRAKRSAAYKGAEVEKDTIIEAAKLPMLNYDEARRLSNNAIMSGFTEGAGKQDQANFSRLRKTNIGLQGMGADEYSALTEKTRRSGGAISDLNKALGAMPAAAKAARMNVDEFRKASVEYAQSLVGTGAQFAPALRAASNWSSITGTAPEVGQALRQAPMIQGLLAAQTGLPQEAQGLISESAVAGASSASLKLMYNTFKSGARNTPGTRTSHGIVGGISAEDKALAMTASQAGIPASEVEKMLNFAPLEGPKGRAMDEIEQYGKQEDDIRKIKDPAARREARRKLAQGDAGDQISRSEIINSLRTSGISNEDLEKIKKERDPRKFEKAARDAVAGDTEDVMNKGTKNDERGADKIKMTVDLRMKGTAAKFFEDLNIETDVNRGAKAKGNSPRGGGPPRHHNPSGNPPNKGLDKAGDLVSNATRAIQNNVGDYIDSLNPFG